MKFTSTLLFFFLSLFLFVIACSEPELPVTKEEAAAVAASLTKAGAHRNAERFNELIDLDAFEKRIQNHAHNTLSRSMMAGAMEGMKKGTFGLQIAKALGNKGTYELVKQYEKDNHQHLVFRLYNEQLNYHDFELIKKGKQVKIADIFVYATGENLSATLAESLQSADAKTLTANKTAKNDYKKVQQVREYLNKGEFEKAKQVFEELPPVLKEQKLYRILYIHIASGLGNDEYLAALNKFQQEYPDAPNMYLLMIDAYFLKKDFAGALRCVNSLDSLINKDLFLDYYRALLSKEGNDPAQQLVYLQRFHQNFPRFGPGTLELINAYVEDEQWDKAVPLTQQYRKNRNADTTTLAYLYLIHPDFKEKMDSAAD